MNGRVFSSPVAGFSVTHMSGSKCAMISEHQRSALLKSSRAHCQSSAVFPRRPGWPRPCQSAPAETARSPSSGCRTGSWIVGSNFDTMSRWETTSHPAASKARPIDFVPQNSSSSLGMFNNYHQRNKARAGKGAA